MKPRTKMQFEVLDLSQNHLLPINDGQKYWAKKTCLDHIGYKTKNKVICVDCGDSFSPDLVKYNRATCSHCLAKLHVVNSKKRTHYQYTDFAIAEIVNEYQVIRCFRIEATLKANQKTHYHVYEILQHWILDLNKREVIARSRGSNFYRESWCGAMEIRDKRKTRKYEVYPFAYHPESVFKPEYKKVGINKNLYGLTFLEAVSAIASSSKAETLIKAKQYNILGQFYNRQNDIYRYWDSIKICIRRNYKVASAVTWFDYLQLLNFFNKDLRNHVYVCPKNLIKEHDRYVAKKQAFERKRRIESLKQKINEAQKEYEIQKGFFFGLVFTDGPLSIKFLDTVKEFQEEGDFHKHCVFTNEYYDRPNSLIFSASYAGERIETVEVNLHTLKVVQSRGLQNKATAYHDAIIALVEKSIPLVEERLKLKHQHLVQRLQKAS